MGPGWEAALAVALEEIAPAVALEEAALALAWEEKNLCLERSPDLMGCVLAWLGSCCCPDLQSLMHMIALGQYELMSDPGEGQKPDQSGLLGIPLPRTLICLL